MIRNADQVRYELADAEARVVELKAELQRLRREEAAAKQAEQPVRDYFADHVKAVGEGRAYADDGYPIVRRDPWAW